MRQSIADFLAYLAEERGLSRNTVSAYRNDLRQFQRYLETFLSSNTYSEPTATDQNGGKLAQVSKEAMVGFFLHLKDQGYAPATVARKVAAVRSLFSFMVKRGLVAHNPTVQVGSPGVRKPVPRTISPQEVEALLAQAKDREGPDGLRNRAMLSLLYATGMRVTELVSLNVSDVDLSAGLVRCIGRRARSRVVPIDLDTRLAVKEYIESGRQAYVKSADEPALFLNHRGQRLTRQGFWLIMKGLARQAGVSQVTPHTLRHTFAAHKLSDGLTLRKLQELLGHANISTTQMYTRLGSSSGHGTAEAEEARAQQQS